jgi:hypothetical protein
MSQERFSFLATFLIENIAAENWIGFAYAKARIANFHLIYFCMPAFTRIEPFLFEVVQLIVIDAFIYLCCHAPIKSRP